MKTPEAEEGWVPFKEMALIFGEDLGNGDVATLHSVEKSFLSLKDAPIGLSFDSGENVGIVKHIRQFPEGIEAEGLIREDLKDLGRPSVAGKIIKMDEKDEHSILEWELTKIGWVLLENDPRSHKPQGADPVDLRKAEALVKAGRTLLETIATDSKASNKEKIDAGSELGKAILDWEKSRA